jgi:hypothetical protein
MRRPVADYLIEISAAVDEEAVLIAPLANDLAPLWPEEPEPDWQAAIDAAREEGRAAGLEAAAAEYDEKLAMTRETFDSDLKNAREAWAADEGQRLREQLDNALAAIEERLTDGVARVVRPFVIASLREQMIAKLIENVRTIVGSSDHIAIKISGPADLLAILQAKLQGSGAACEYVEHDAIDVGVVTNETSIDTQLRAWIDLIGKEA